MKPPAFWYPHETGSRLRVPLAARLLSPLGWLYDFGGRVKRWTTTPSVAPVPVLCVGNLTAGGTGKTPLAVTIVSMLKDDGVSPVILTRGYGGREAGPLLVNPDHHRADDVGDEPLLLARAAPVVVARRRAEGAALAAAHGADVIIMDDGFQNPDLNKTLSLLVVDGAVLFGNERVIPAGPLRERIASGLARAGAVIIMGQMSERAARFAREAPVPVFHARLEPEPAALSRLRGRSYLAFAGIGRPEKFFDTARTHGLNVKATRAFPDHHVFTRADLDQLTAHSQDLGATLLTTEKDAARLPDTLRARAETLPVRAEIADAAAFRAFLLRRLALEPDRRTP